MLMSLNQSSFACEKAESLGSSSLRCSMPRAVFGVSQPQSPKVLLRVETNHGTTEAGKALQDHQA